MRRVSKAEALADMAARGFVRAGANGCAMCELASEGGSSDTSLRVRDDEHAVVVLDRYASTRGNLLVVLRRHVERISELPLATHLEVQRLVFELTDAERSHAPTIYTRRSAHPCTAAAGAAIAFPISRARVRSERESARPATVFSGRGILALDEARRADRARSPIGWRSSR